MTSYDPISCDHYDYLEIACMDRYEVELQLNDLSVTGRADQLTAEHGIEVLLLRQADGSLSRVRVDSIVHMRVITRPARFTDHRFS